MTSVAEDIAAVRDDVVNSEFYLEILELIIEVQRELDEATGENGDFILEGEGFPSPSGVVEVHYTCPGWDDDTDPGTIELTMTLRGGDIEPVIWGLANECRFLVRVGSEDFQASYDGDIAVHLGDLVPPGQDLYQLAITFATIGTIGFGGNGFGIDQSFRVALSSDDAGRAVLDRLEILVELNDGGTFVYVFEEESTTQGIRDATGSFGCSLVERQCTGLSGTFSW